MESVENLLYLSTGTSGSTTNGRILMQERPIHQLRETRKLSNMREDKGHYILKAETVNNSLSDVQTLTGLVTPVITSQPAELIKISKDN